MWPVPHPPSSWWWARWFYRLPYLDGWFESVALVLVELCCSGCTFSKKICGDHYQVQTNNNNSSSNHPSSIRPSKTTHSPLHKARAWQLDLEDFLEEFSQLSWIWWYFLHCLFAPTFHPGAILRGKNKCSITKPRASKTKVKNGQFPPFASPKGRGGGMGWHVSVKYK